MSDIETECREVWEEAYWDWICATSTERLNQHIDRWMEVPAFRKALFSSCFRRPA